MTKLTCHCGAIELEVRLADGLRSAQRCDCSFCRRRGAAAVTVPLDGLRIVKGADKLTLYQWGTNTAKHYFCRHCGIHAFYRPRSHPDRVDVNVHCLEGIDPNAFDVTHFDGQNWEANIDKLPDP